LQISNPITSKRWEKYEVSEEPPKELFLARAEDTILHKLHWFRLGNSVSERQWDDVTGVLKVQNERLDFSYLRRTAKQMGVTDLLDQALKDTGLL
jgi:hypothetical protein